MRKKLNTNSDRETLFTVIPICRKDYLEAVELLPWINELGGCKTHEVLLFFSADVPYERRECLVKVATKGWKAVYVEATPWCLPHERWPIGPNWMHQCAARWVMLNKRQPWFWMEPDCVPLKPGWLGAIEKEYNDGFKPFLGVKEPAGGTYPSHISGCRVSPWYFYNRYWSSYEVPTTPFDVMDTERINAEATESKIMCFIYNQHGIAPRFYLPEDLNTISPKAVLFHRNKDGSLIRLLREARQ